MAIRPSVAARDNLAKQLSAIGDALRSSTLKKGPKASGCAGLRVHDVALRWCNTAGPSLNPATTKTKLPRNLPDRLPGIIQRSDFVKNGLTVCTPGQCYDLFTCFVALFLILVIFAS